jgi:hypothetical protein
MKTSIIVAIALAISSSVVTHAQTTAPSKPTPTEPKFPSGVTPKKVTPAKFKSEYDWVGKAQSMHEVTYLGQRDGRAYINRNSMSAFSRKWTAQVIYVELSELEQSFRDSLPKTELKDSK